ncbi:hypothetical protein H8A95_21935 [Bradyrhizobium sp. Pear76]|uniref:hypothetical protein n=1 Tax=Bradyrhizobium oropedii TaxID=1571201 RepID=UPI001E2C2563|nr:hypothetical protein [Bradyrhizobium oropedii]MCC8964899.1 hypothetical protein [Bradyrhizobium oropedii]
MTDEISDDAWSMTPDQVTAKLAEMSKQFDAATKPATSSSEPTAEQLAADLGSALEKRDAATVLDHLIQAGLSPEITDAGREVQEYIHGKRSITPQLRAAVDAKVESWKRDGEFQKKLFAGDPEATRLLTIASAMRIAPVKEPA